ncbi:STAS-like domain-containing protein [Dolichospermum sp. LEGE 00240]|uniref:STAS-like domain-containing protein n=1 Tax=Aphanizomenonaceae TaxID=1892259 RepID=UPI001880EFDF|nr:MULTISPECIES: STAS-like domain-containing protein [Aphanizomenonaceae]MBE9248499.1 STAS-like domain-containing protein [Dolichospermum sp. LEGE 00240]MDB9310986.1 STAS-like domain-containing protein [Aphanizomenon sp. CS-733/32]MDM3851982.1 STAS-like domain-containing protein [Aphanizomenon gracile PMC627.10]MDM3859587.1 STAS-like domain-containing protein [Aphanizomenon gracile PMC644.10]
MIHNIYNMVGELATTEEPGQKLYEIIHPCLLRGEPVELDFTGVKVFASPFMNFAFGQLLKDISPEKLNQLIEFTSLNDDGWDVLQYIMTKAKRYYSDEKYRHAVDAVMTDMAESI